MVPAFEPLFLIGTSILVYWLFTKEPRLISLGIWKSDLGGSAVKGISCLKELPITITLS